VKKSHFEQRVYVTDAAGVVRYDSGGEWLGQDHREWNNIARALAGGYGARSSHTPRPDSPSVMHISALMRRDGVPVGVVTLAQPVAELDPFIALARSKVAKQALSGSLLALFLGLLIAWGLGRSVAKLGHYARAVAAGGRARMPKLYGELGELASAMELMRSKLDGKAYVEQAMHTFAHEARSPLSAIAASAELLESDLALADRQVFARDVQQSAARLQQLLARLLELASVERQSSLHNPALLNLADIAAAVVADFRAISAHAVAITLTLPAQDTPIIVRAEQLLLEQCIRNLLANASEFAAKDTAIDVFVMSASGGAEVRIRNRGPAVPEFAIARVFERYYSLQRPDGGPRSTGLGLAFVREVAHLHGGTATLKNEPGGVSAYLQLPLASAKSAQSR
jgi:two-component system, OmpR family, sensor histidine kinase CreC